MNKIWGIILIGLGMSGAMQAELTQEMQTVNPTEEWHDIVNVSKEVFSTDQEMQQAVQKTIAEFQNLLSVMMKKITRQVSPTEKEKIVTMIQLLNRMVDVCGDAVRAGGAVDGEAAEELRNLGEELTEIVEPLMFLMQDPIFAREQVQFLRDLRVETYNNVKRTLNQLNNDIQSK